ncbi:UDP-N-acetylmuramoyl-tripeptide--D-alanyl-D-alanine ligase [Ruminococcaceae bacterium OttesenSCG-928-D13]|nr:UDP-N-acetylmuramoyl-tripeptide--D-alanyl-D-alanine ligase [Ruminococcaceae bacterium OttesenSCG-928-D13]
MEAVSAKVLLKGLWAGAPAGLTITNVVTDSREVTPGCLFVAIKGERVDGHDFAAGAFENGAALVLASRPVEGLPPDRTVLVPDVLDAMIRMGANYRAQYSPLVLGVTGSVGKTSTKEFCAAIFSAFGETLKTEGNQNNEIGLPKTLFKMNDDTRYAVIEMGMQGPGEIRKLSFAAAPDGAIITRIGMMHLEQMGSLENILRAKLEVSEGIASGGVLILNGDDPLLRGAAVPQGLQVVYAGPENPENEVRAKNVRHEAHGLVFEIVDARYGNTEAFIPAVGRHNVGNALLAYTAATRFGLGAQQAAAALAAYLPAGARQKVETIREVTVIEDFYNAGPDSMAAALDTLGEMATGGRRIAVLGNMLELGAVSEEQHRRLGRLAQKAGVDLLLTVGDLAALAAEEAAKLGLKTLPCASNAEVAALLWEKTRPGDLLLLKASRGMKFEEILELFSEAPE